MEFKIENINLPEICTAADLIDAGIVSNNCTLSSWRKKGGGPVFKKIGNSRYIYAREDVINWLKGKDLNNMRSGFTKRQIDQILDKLGTIEMCADKILQKLTNFEANGNKIEVK